MRNEVRVLCVDDDPDTREVMGSLLERRGNGLAVTGVPGGEEAIDAVEERSVDCIVSDYDMAGMDGLELLEAVRERNPDLPFILYTGKGSEGLASEAIAAGVTDYVPKGSGTEQYELLANRIENAVLTMRARKERRQHEQILTQYRTLVERAGDPMYALDAEGCCLLANEALARFTGYERDEIEGEHFSKFVSEGDYDTATAALAEQVGSRDGGTIVEFVLGAEESDGRVGEANVTALTDDSGEYIGSVGIVRDISERKRRERELAQYETIVETVPEGILVLDQNGLVKWSNERFVTHMEYTREDVSGKSFLEFVEEGIFDQDVVGRYQDILRELLTSSNDVDEVTFYVDTYTPRGGTRHFESKTALLPLENGEFVGTVTAFRDITQQIRYRRELERQNERLEQFARFVSHDLRNPINVAQGHVEVLEEVTDHESVEKTAWAVDRMDELIDDMLAMARQGQTVDEFDALSLETVATKAWEMVETGDASLVVENDCAFEGARGRVCELFENLFRNAIEHGGKEVTVTVGTVTEGRRGGLGFFVEDDGEGLEEVEDIFEFGYTTNPDGTGFGLGIVEQVAGAHGWQIQATNGTAGGARFSFTGVTRPDR